MLLLAAVKKMVIRGRTGPMIENQGTSMTLAGLLAKREGATVLIRGGC